MASATRISLWRRWPTRVSYQLTKTFTPIVIIITAKLVRVTWGDVPARHLLNAPWPISSAAKRRRKEMPRAAKLSNLQCPYGWERSAGRTATVMVMRPMTLAEPSSREWKPSATMLRVSDDDPYPSLRAATNQLRTRVVARTVRTFTARPGWDMAPPPLLAGGPSRSMAPTSHTAGQGLPSRAVPCILL